MKLKDIIALIEDRIPLELALSFDNVGLMGEYDLNQEITTIKVFMDLWKEDDSFGEDTLIITHHPPLFSPKTPTYTIHSNWDIIDGGANDALAECLDLEVIDYFDNETNIGRVCRLSYEFGELKKAIQDNFENARIVNRPKDDAEIKTVGIISGFGLKNPEYIQLAHDKKLDMLISGDLTQETAILAKNLNLTLIDLGHHESEVPGLYALAELLGELNIKVETVDKKPIDKLE